jgi:hypothetical protein
MWHVLGRSVLWGLVGKRGGKDHFVDLGVEGKIILKRTLKYDGKAWTGFVWLR